MGEKDSAANEKKVVGDADNTKKQVEESPITVVLKLDLHCDGCAKKVKKSVRYIQGVKTVKADSVNNKLTVTGKVDPVHIKERVEFKTKKKVEIVSPKPKKEEEGVKKSDDDNKPAAAEAKSNTQKPKEPQSTTVVLKIPLHCDGCIQKIKRIILKIDGVESVNADGNKNLVTVKGTMSMKELIPYLKDKLKRNIDIVPPKNEDNKKIDEKKVEEKDSKKEKEGDTNGDNKKKNDDGKPSEITEKTKTDEPKPATGESEKKTPDNEAKTINKADGEASKNVDLMNKYEYSRHNPNYIYTMPVYNHNYYNQDYGVSVVSSSHGYVNEGYVNHGYVMEYPRGPPPPPSPLSLHVNPPSLESDIFSADNPNACSLM